MIYLEIFSIWSCKMFCREIKELKRRMILNRNYVMEIKINKCMLEGVVSLFFCGLGCGLMECGD